MTPLRAAKLRIAFLGDSITAGDGDAHACGWPARLMQATTPLPHKMQCYNLGVGGDRIADVARRSDAELATRLTGRDGTGTILMIGVNDALKAAAHRDQIPYDPTITDAHFSTILRAAQTHGPVLIVEPAPVLEDLKRDDGAHGSDIMDVLARIVARQHEVAKTNGVPVVHVTQTLKSDAVFTTALEDNDGLHPTAAGYARIAGLVGASPLWADFIESVLSQRGARA